MTIANLSKRQTSILDYYSKEAYRFDPCYTKEYHKIQERLSKEQMHLNHDPLRFLDASKKDKERILDMVRTVEELIPNLLVKDAFDVLREAKQKAYLEFSNFYTETTYVLNKIDLPSSFKSGSSIRFTIEYLCNRYHTLRIDVLLDKTKTGTLKYRILDVSFKRKEK